MSASGSRRRPHPGSARAGSGNRPGRECSTRRARRAPGGRGRAASSRDASSPPFRAATAPGQNSLPTTAARWSTSRSPGSRRSSRAVRSAWIVGGSVTSSTAVAGLVGEHRDELLGVERIPLRNLGDAAAELRREDAARRRARREAASPRRTRAARAARARPPTGAAPRAARDARRRGGGSVRRGSSGSRARRGRAASARPSGRPRGRRAAAVPARGARRAAAPPRRAPPAERLPRPPSTRRRSTTSAASGSLAHRFRHRLLAAETLDELRERPEGDPVAVGEAAPGGDGRVPADLGDELRHEPRLADPGRPDHRHQPALTAVRARRQLRPAGARARRVLPTSGVSQRRANESAPAIDAEHAPCLDGSALALRFDRRQRPRAATRGGRAARSPRRSGCRRRRPPPRAVSRC